jgi:transposase
VSRVAVEASASGSFVYEQLDAQGIEVQLAHPTIVRPFAKQYVNTDKVDAIVLAHPLRKDYPQESYVPGEAMRDLRTPSNTGGGGPDSGQDITKKSIACALDDGKGAAAGGMLSLWYKRTGVPRNGQDPRAETVCDGQLSEDAGCSQRATHWSRTDHRGEGGIDYGAGWLRFIPGIGFQRVVFILSEVSEVRRFSSFHGFVCYTGLAPKVAQSGNQVWYGYINRQSNGFLRWAMIRSAWVAVRISTSNRFQRIYQKVKTRRGAGGDRGHCASSGRIGLWDIDQARSLSGNKAGKALPFS